MTHLITEIDNLIVFNPWNLCLDKEWDFFQICREFDKDI